MTSSKLEVRSSKFKKLKSLLSFFVLTSYFALRTSHFVWAQPTGAAFLKIPVGARAVGMGSAYSSLVDDASALYWNPAGISRVGRLDLLASYNKWIADTQENYMGFACRLMPKYVLGASYLSLTMDPLERRGEQGEKLGTFQAQDRAMSVGLAMSVTRRLAVGAAIKRIEQTIDDAQARGNAFDFGFQARVHRRVSLGAALLNVGPAMKFISQPYKLPTTFNGGVGIYFSGMLTLALEAKKELNSPDKKTDFAAGLEYNLAHLTHSYFWSPVVWRAGYFSPHGPGIGVGLKIFGARLDYALAPMGELGLTHRASFHMRFGKLRTFSRQNGLHTTKSEAKLGQDQPKAPPAAATEARPEPSSQQEKAEPKKKKKLKTGTFLDVLF